MTSLRDLDLATGGHFTYRWSGEDHACADPADLSHEQIIVALYVGIAPGTVAMPLGRADALFARWVAHFDLPTFEQARRLAYVVERYTDALEYDLQTIAGVDLGQMWRSRQWRRLLNLIDHLPRNCWYSESVANDEEHAKMIAEAMERAKANGEHQPNSGPPMHTWSPEAAILADVVNALRALSVTVAASNGAKGLKEPAPYPTPKTALDGLQKAAYYERRQAAHQALAARLLPHKRG